jgi:hypothetical protein
MDEIEREAIRAEGLDPDDPAVVMAIDLVRWELLLHFGDRAGARLLGECGFGQLSHGGGSIVPGPHSGGALVAPAVARRLA